MIEGKWWLYDAEGGFDRATCTSLWLRDGAVTADDGSAGSYFIDGDTLSLSLPSFFHSRKAVPLRQGYYSGKPLAPIDEYTSELRASGTSHDCLMMRKDGEWVEETAAGHEATSLIAGPVATANDR